MTESGDAWHTVNPPIEDAVQIPYDGSEMGLGSFVIEVEFDSAEMDRLEASIPPGPVGIAHFIKNAALAEADRRAGVQQPDAMRESA